MNNASPYPQRVWMIYIDGAYRGKFVANDDKFFAEMLVRKVYGHRKGLTLEEVARMTLVEGPIDSGATKQFNEQWGKVYAA
jgi:hypothetical protein